jgi:P-aminobenzoate N-oxygenase AurF
MSTMYRYALPVELTEWKFDGAVETRFTWEYDDERQGLLALYDKGKKQQWDAALRIDWSQDLDPENPMMLDDRLIPIYGSAIWDRLTDKEKVQVRHHQQASTISQFMHGEQGALIATAKIVQSVPDLDSKFYAATQVMDEARHVEAYSRLLHEKFELAYPITPGLKALLENGLSDNRWDMTYLTMQVLIEGLALAAFQRLRDFAGNPLAAAVNAYVMQDEARHVAFGRLALRDYYPELSDAERDEREAFVVEACYHMRDRFNQWEVWERLGLPAEECVQVLMASDTMKQFRTRLFSRIVPTVKDIGLWGPRVQKAFEDMGVLSFGEIDAQAMLDNDGRVAEAFDAKKRVADVIGSAAAD